VRKLAIIPFLLLLTACALNQSFSGRVAAAYAAVAATNDTAVVLVNAGTISKPEGRQVLDKMRAVRQAIDVASAAGDGAALEQALALLREAQAELCKGNETNPNCILLTQQRSAP
jgi:F420-0:gamma-glutamyl ligase